MSIPFTFLDTCRKGASWSDWSAQIPDEWPERFIEELDGFLRSFGYVLREDDKLVMRFVMWAWSHAHVAHSDPKHRYIVRHPDTICADDEEWNWYCYTISSEDWDEFMDRWSIYEWCDTYTDTGHAQRRDLARFVWARLDLGASSANKHILEVLKSEEEDETDTHEAFLAHAASSTAYGGDRRTY